MYKASLKSRNNNYVFHLRLYMYKTSHIIHNTPSWFFEENQKQLQIDQMQSLSRPDVFRFYIKYLVLFNFIYNDIYTFIII